MKRIVLVALAALMLLVPTFAAAAPQQLVYRPELRAMVPVPVAGISATTVKSPVELIAEHQAMAAGYALNPRGGTAAADHCNRIVKQAQEALRLTR